MSPNPINEYTLVNVTEPVKFMCFVAMDVTKPYTKVRLGAMDVTKPYKIYTLWGHGGLQTL